MAKRVKCPKVIHISGKRWFEKTNGNTYNSVQIYIDGEELAYLGYEYGYGSFYRQRAEAWLKEQGYAWRMPEFRGVLRWLRDEKGVKIIDEVADVPRKRDL